MPKTVTARPTCIRTTTELVWPASAPLPNVGAPLIVEHPVNKYRVVGVDADTRIITLTPIRHTIPAHVCND